MVKRLRVGRHKARRACAPQGVAAGMRLTFRAELMPGRAAGERTFTITRVLASGRVELAGLCGQHALKEFEPAQREGTLGE